MLSNLVHILKWCNNEYIPNGTSWRECYLDQSAPKPSLSRTKFEQLYIGNFLLLISTFVDMFRASNDNTTPSGASRRIDLHDYILGSPFLLISRVYKSCIGNFSRMDSILVEPLVFSCHLALSSLMTRGVHLVSQINNKHLLPFF